MKLSQAVTIFHKTIIQDAYDLASYFRGRVSQYDDNARDSLMSDRRILSVAGEVALPPRRTVMIEGQAYILGDEAIDRHAQDVLHRKVIMHKTDYMAEVRTFEEVLLGTGTRDMWAARLWVKEMKEPEESAHSYGSYEIFFAKGETLYDSRANTIDGDRDCVLVKIENRWHMVRDVISTSGGFQCAICDELPEPVLSTVSFNSKVYDPVTDTDTDTVLSIQGLFIRWQAQYKYLHSYSTKFKAGDYILTVLKDDVTPQADDVVTVAGRDFRVVSALDQGATWACHIRLP